MMRTGAEYREALRDRRRVWVIGEGLVEDVTVHPATRATVDEYVAWYDRHFDPEWHDVLLTPPDTQGARAPWAYALPKSVQDLRAMGRSFSATTFLSAGNITHTPAYGNLIALGILDAVQQRNVSPEQIANAAGHRELIARTGRFLTFSAGAATIGYRMRPDPAERLPLKLVRETVAGMIVRGKVGMHTSPVYADHVYVGSHCGIERGPHRATFTVPVAAPGVTVLCRKIAPRHPNPFLSPLSSRFDELDGQMWLDDVFIPWEHVFLMDVTPEPMASWLFWHQLYCWLSKAEFTLGLALAAPEVGAGLEESFAGGGYTALQRSALLQLACDHVASALDGRESAFELHANGGIPAWRGRMRRYFSRYSELANGVLRSLNLDMPTLDLEGLRAAPLAPRRPVTPPR